MSYCRFNLPGSKWGPPSDLYVFLHYCGYLECCGCKLGDGKSFDATTTKDMINHIKLHRKAGHTVPRGLIKSLLADAKENDAWMADPDKEDTF